LYINQCFIIDDYDYDELYPLNIPQTWGTVEIQHINQGPIAEVTTGQAYGVFATVNIPANTRIGQITGTYRRAHTLHQEQQYQVQYIIQSAFGGGRMHHMVCMREGGNEARFVNSYHGIKATPNVDTQIEHYQFPGGFGTRVRFYLVSTANIQVGDQLLAPYDVVSFCYQW
jgi:hypothetical protein